MDDNDCLFCCFLLVMLFIGSLIIIISKEFIKLYIQTNTTMYE